MDNSFLIFFYDDTFWSNFLWICVCSLLALSVEMHHNPDSDSDSDSDQNSNSNPNKNQGEELFYYFVFIALFAIYFLFIVKPLSNYGTVSLVEKILSYFCLSFLFGLAFSIKGIINKLINSDFQKYLYIFILGVSIHFVYAAIYELCYICDNSSYQFIETENAESRLSEINYLLDKQGKLLEKFIFSKFIISVSENSLIRKSPTSGLHPHILWNLSGTKIQYYVNFNNKIDSSIMSFVIERVTPPDPNGGVSYEFKISDNLDSNLIVAHAPLASPDEFFFEYEILDNIYTGTEREKKILIHDLLNENFRILAKKYLMEIEKIRKQLSTLDANSSSLSYFDFLLFSLHTSSWIGHGIIIPNTSVVKIFSMTQVFMTLFLFLVLFNITRIEIIRFLKINEPNLNVKPEDKIKLTEIDGIGPSIENILINNKIKQVKNVNELAQLNENELLEIINSESKRKYSLKQAVKILNSAKNLNN